jgi:hypothetical protein
MTYHSLAKVFTFTRESNTHASNFVQPYVRDLPVEDSLQMKYSRARCNAARQKWRAQKIAEKKFLKCCWQVSAVIAVRPFAAWNARSGARRCPPAASASPIAVKPSATFYCGELRARMRQDADCMMS